MLNVLFLWNVVYSNLSLKQIFNRILLKSIFLNPRCTCTCVKTGVFLHVPLAHEVLLTQFTLELFGDIVQCPVHLQAVFVGEGFSTDLTGVGAYTCVT